MLPGGFVVTTSGNTWVEPSTDFDYERVDNPEGVALEELRHLSRRMNLGVYVHPDHARLCLAWAAAHGVGPSAPLLERVGLWLGSSKGTADIGLRAAIFIHTFAPLARHGASGVQIRSAFRVGKQNLCRLKQNLKATLFEKEYPLGPDGEIPHREGNGTTAGKSIGTGNLLRRGQK